MIRPEVKSIRLKPAKVPCLRLMVSKWHGVYYN